MSETPSFLPSAKNPISFDLFFRYSLEGQSILDFLPMRFLFSQLLHPISTDKRHFVAKCSPHYLADQTLVMIDPKENIDADILWMYLNSTVSYVIFELYGRRLGAGNLVVAKGVMESIPVPNLSNFRYNIEMSDTLSNLVLKYDQVLTNEKRQKFDIEILKLIGIEKSEKVIDELYNAFIEIVNDRLIKSEKGR